MYIAIVQIPGLKRTQEEAITAGLASAEKFTQVDGLISKHYLAGESGGGGVYLFESQEKAEAWFNDDWWPMMEKTFGVRPTLTCYHNHVVVDNSAGEIRVDGKKVETAA